MASFLVIRVVKSQTICYMNYTTWQLPLKAFLAQQGYRNSSFSSQIPFPVDESLVNVHICLSIERNTAESLCGSLEPNSSKISCVVAWPIVVHCNAIKFLIWTSKSSLLFPGPSAFVSLLGTRLFRALILASSWLEWTGSEPSAIAVVMPIWSPLKWGLLSALEEVCLKQHMWVLKWLKCRFNKKIG